MNRLLVVACCWAVAGSVKAQDMKTVLRCQMGRDEVHSVELLRSHAIADTSVYYIRQDEQMPEPMYPGDEDQSRGGEIESECAGGPERVLVVSGEFPSNYTQGMAIRFNDSTREWERIDFAERMRPTRVYLDASGMRVVIPNLGHETDKKYIVYQYVSGHGQTASPQAVNVMPRNSNSDIADLRKH